MNFRHVIVVIACVAGSASAFAQPVVETNLTPGQTYLAVTQFGINLGICDFPTSFCVTPTHGIPLNAFATSSDIANLNNRVNAINAQLASMNADISRSLEIGAIAASMRDAIPNPGDRFAIRLNAAGFNGYAGGSLGVSMNITDSVRLSANYGRGATQNVVSGGLNVSFR
jgi:hypothetical protein